MRRAAKRDGNEAALAKIPPLYGWTIRKLSDTGKPDWICMRRCRVVFIEIKDEGGTLTPAQEKEFPLFEAAGCTVHVCRTELDVRKALGLPVEDVLTPLTKGAIHLGTPDAEDDVIAVVDTRAGHLVTTAYQKAQSAAVVPPKRETAKGAQDIAARLNANPGRTRDHVATGGYVVAVPRKDGRPPERKKR